MLLMAHLLVLQEALGVGELANSSFASGPTGTATSTLSQKTGFIPSLITALFKTPVTGVCGVLTCSGDGKLAGK
jgi:hypothetical protein